MKPAAEIDDARRAGARMLGVAIGARVLFGVAATALFFAGAFMIVMKIRG